MSVSLEQIKSAMNEAVGTPCAGAVSEVIPVMAAAVSELLDPKPETNTAK
jgi:hypothetical protein